MGERWRRGWELFDRFVAIVVVLVGVFLVAVSDSPSTSGWMFFCMPALFFWWTRIPWLVVFLCLSPFAWFFVAFACDKSAAQKSFGEQMVHHWHEYYWVLVVYAVIRIFVHWRDDVLFRRTALDQL